MAWTIDHQLKELEALDRAEVVLEDLPLASHAIGILKDVKLAAKRTLDDWNSEHEDQLIYSCKNRLDGDDCDRYTVNSQRDGNAVVHLCDFCRKVGKVAA